MAQEFDPAPPDTLAEDPNQAQSADLNAHDKLEKGLEGTFPASDPPAALNPVGQKPEA